MQFKIIPETAMPTVESTFIKDKAKCLNVDLMKFHITVGGKLGNLSKAGSPHDEASIIDRKLVALGI